MTNLPNINDIKEFLSKKNTKLSGFYNDNYIMEYNNTKFLLRIPKLNAPILDIKTTIEKDTLIFLEKNNIASPKFIAEYKDSSNTYTLHEFINGKTWQDTNPSSWFLKSLATEILKFHSIKIEYKNYKMPWDYNAKSVYQYLYNYTKDSIKQAIADSADFFIEINFPLEIDAILKNNASKISNENLCFCHSDIHKNNVLIDNKQITIIDWELAKIATPSYELAVIVHRAKLSPKEKQNFIKHYCNASQLDYDSFCNQVDIYLELEEIKSAYADVKRFRDIIKQHPKQRDDLIKNYYQKIIKVCNRWQVRDVISIEKVATVF